MAKRTKKETTAVVEPTDEIDEFDTAGASDMFGDSMPVRKAKHFWPSVKRLFGLMASEKKGMIVVVALVVGSVVLTVICVAFYRAWRAARDEGRDII